MVSYGPVTISVELVKAVGPGLKVISDGPRWLEKAFVFGAARLIALDCVLQRETATHHVRQLRGTGSRCNCVDIGGSSTHDFACRFDQIVYRCPSIVIVKLSLSFLRSVHLLCWAVAEI